VLNDARGPLEPVAHAAQGFDFTQAAGPQVDQFMAVVAEARSALAEDSGGATPEDVVIEIEKLLKVTVLVARVSHQGAMKIADKEIEEQNTAINRAQQRPAQYLDLNQMRWVEQPSKATISLAVFLVMVDSGIAAPEERPRPFADEENQPEIMKQFAAQWVVHVYTEWEEHFSEALGTALGYDKADIKSRYFADLGRMRQDYVHNRGICRNSARNKVLKWYSKGQQMIPTHANYHQLLTAFPAEELTVKPAPAVGQRQPVKANADPALIRRFEETADHFSVSKDAALDQALSEWIAAHQPSE
jgi:hypothetical protein